MLLTLLILSVILGMALGISALLSREIRLSIDISKSTRAFFAADTGWERLLYAINKESYDLAACSPLPCNTPYSDNLSNGASYATKIEQVTPTTRIISSGEFMGIIRAIEASY